VSNTDDQCQSLPILPECVASAPAKRPYVSPQLLTVGTAGNMVQGRQGPQTDFLSIPGWSQMVAPRKGNPTR